MTPGSLYIECLGMPKNEDFNCSDTLTFQVRLNLDGNLRSRVLNPGRHFFMARLWNELPDSEIYWKGACGLAMRLLCLTITESFSDKYHALCHSLKPLIFRRTTWTPTCGTTGTTSISMWVQSLSRAGDWRIAYLVTLHDRSLFRATRGQAQCILGSMEKKKIDNQSSGHGLR